MMEGPPIGLSKTIKPAVCPEYRRCNASTDDVVRMTVKTAKLPESSNVCEISADLNLQMVRIGDGQILLPSQARQHYVLTNGEETENTFTFGDAASTWANRA